MKPKQKTSVFRWFLALAIVALAVGGVLYWQRSGEAIRHLAQIGLEKKFPSLRVRIDSAGLVETRGIRIRGLRLYDPETQDERLLFEAEELFIETPINLSAALGNDARPTRAVVRRPTVHLSGSSARWRGELIKLKPHREKGDPIFPLEILGGTLVISQNADQNTGSFACSGIDLAILPPGHSSSELAECANRFDFSEPETAAGGNTGERTDLWRMAGEAKNGESKTFTVGGRALADGSNWSISGAVERFDIGPEQTRLFECPPKYREQIESLRGQTSLVFSVRKDSRQASGFDYSVDGEFFRGSVAVDYLPHPISDLYVKYRLTNRQTRVERLTGRSGPALVLADYQREERDGRRIESFRTQLEEFPLTEKAAAGFKAYFPPKAAEAFERHAEDYSFSTTAKVRLAFAGIDGRWTPQQIALDCRKLAVESKKLPFKLPLFDGTVSLDENERLAFSFRSEEGTPSMSVTGNYTAILSKPLGETNVEANGVQLDEKLLRFLPEGCRKELESLHPSGSADLRLTVCGRNAEGDASLRDKALTIDVRDAAIRYDRFPYPISQISGRIENRNGVWTFRDFRGIGGAAELKAKGGIAPAADGRGREFTLDVRLDRFPIGEELRDAVIAPHLKELLAKLHLQGRSGADVRIGYREADKKFSLAFEAYPIPELTSIRPDHFPYELKELDGVLVYRDGAITIPNLRGKNGPMTFSAQVGCRFAPDGSWAIDIAPYTVDQLHLDHQLQNAVPSALLTLLERLKVSGYFNTSGAVSFRKRGPDAPVEAVWDTDVILNQNVADLGVPVESVCGRATLRGAVCEGGPLQLHGELNLDNLCVDDLQITRLTGPLWYSDDRILFGNTVPPAEELPIYQNEFLRSRLRPVSNGPAAVPLPGNVGPNHIHPGDPSAAAILRGQSGNIAPVGYAAQTDPYNPFRIKNGAAIGSNLQNSPNTQSMPNAQSAPPFSGTPNAQNSSADELLRAADPTRSLQSLQAAENALLSGRPLSGRLFRGQASLSGVVRLTRPISYQLSFLLKDGNLNDITRDLTEEARQLNGKVTAHVQLQGEGKNIATLRGSGGVVLKEAELYELPQIIKILQTLSIKEPDRAAFNSSYIDFRVFGNRLSLDRTILEGNALTLFGSGWLTLEGKERLIDLEMNSRLGNADSRIPVVSDVIGGAGDQIARIRVEGPLSDPSIRQERFPGIKKAWWSVFPDSAPDPTERPSEKKKRGLFGGKD